MTFAIVILDQVTKFSVKGIDIPLFGLHHTGMELNTSKELIDGFLFITFIENPGMAFGINVGAKFYFSLFTILATIGIAYYFYSARKENYFMRLGIALVLAGAIGNMIDRVFYGVIFNEAPLMYGKVVDFIDIAIFNYHWFVFNVADSSVSIGVSILFLHYLHESRISKQIENDNPSN